jgi:hypothetical protein
MKSALDGLMETMQAASADLYAKATQGKGGAGAAGAGAGPAGGGASSSGSKGNGGDDVVDADFEDLGGKK